MSQPLRLPERGLETASVAAQLLAPDAGLLLVDLRAPIVDGESCRLRGAGSSRLERRQFELLSAAVTALERLRPSHAGVKLPTAPFLEAGLRASVGVAAADAHGWHTLLLCAGPPGAKLPKAASLVPLVRRSPPPPPALGRALEGLAAGYALPAALVEQGAVRWVSDDLWGALGVACLRLGQLCVDPSAPAAAARIEACARGERTDGLRATELSEGVVLVHATDAAAARRAAVVRRAAARFPLSRVDRLELAHVLDGLSSKESSARDGISVETSRERRRQLYRKTGAGGAGRLRALLEAL